jgi:hypothetical protein
VIRRKPGNHEARLAPAGAAEKNGAVGLGHRIRNGRNAILAQVGGGEAKKRLPCMGEWSIRSASNIFPDP